MKSRQNITQHLPIFKHQSGMTMMEIIAVMAIIVTVVVGTMSLFSVVQSDNSAVTVLKDIVAIRSAIQQSYIGQGEYNNNNAQVNEQLFDAKAALSSMTWRNNKTLRTSWDGTVIFSADGVRPQDFKIRLTAVPPDLCAQLVSSASNGWKSVQVGMKTYNTFPVRPTDASKECGNSAKDIIWTTLN